MSRGETVESSYTTGSEVEETLTWPDLVLIECECGFVGTPESGMVNVFGTTLYCPGCHRNTAQVVYDEQERSEVPSGLLFDDEDDE